MPTVRNRGGHQEEAAPPIASTTAGAPPEFPPLGARQLKFALAYLAHGNAARAAREAGYKESNAHVQGHQLLRKPNIRAFLMAKGAEVATELKVTAESLLSQMAHLAFSSMAHFLSFDDDGHAIIDVSRASPEQMAAIALLETKTASELVMTPEGEVNRQTVTVTRIRLHPSERALEKLSRHLFGMYASDAGAKSHDDVDILAELEAMVRKECAPLPMGNPHSLALREHSYIKDKTQAIQEQPTTNVGGTIRIGAGSGATDLSSNEIASHQARCPYCGR